MSENQQTQIVRTTVLVPVYCPLRDANLLKGLVRQLCTLSCKIRLRKEKPTPVFIKGIPNTGKGLADYFVKLQITTIFRPESWSFGENDSAQKCFDNFCSEAEFRFHGLIEKLVIAANIARPGSINILEGGTFSCEGHIEFRSRYKLFMWSLRSRLYELFETYSRKRLPWPKIKCLPLAKVWNWLERTPDFKKGLGTTPLGHALSAFTYLFTHGDPNSGNDDDFPLLWLMPIVGLEAIYESGSSKRTFKERCELFLKWPAKKSKFIGSKIDELYKRRDSLIHGGMNLRFKFGYDARFPEVEDSWRAVWSLDEAIPIFMATLQRMVESGVHRLQFELQLKTKVNSDNFNHV